MAQLLVRPGTGKFNATVTVPIGDNVEIDCAYQSGIWGTQIEPAVALPNGLFLVTADNVGIKHCSFPEWRR